MNDFDEVLLEAIEDAVAYGLLDEGSVGFGITQRVIHRGYDSLTLKQRITYSRDVIPALKKIYESQRMREILSSVEA